MVLEQLTFEKDIRLMFPMQPFIFKMGLDGRNVFGSIDNKRFRVSITHFVYRVTEWYNLSSNDGRDIVSMTHFITICNHNCIIQIQNRMKSKTSSQLITAYTETKHNMQLKADREKLMSFQSEIKARAKRIKKADVGNSFNQNIQLAEKFKEMKNHKIPLPEFEVQFKTNLKTGLSSQEAKARLERDGLNKLSQKEGVSWIVKLFAQMSTPFALLLWAGATLSFVAYGLSNDASNLYLAIVICVIVVGTGLLSFYQTMKSEAIMDSFKDFIPSKTLVVRDGIERSIETSTLVVGDVVSLKLGDKIPADIRIIECLQMKVDNSSLTGETELLPRSTQCTNQNPLQTENIAFFSTLLKEGTGRGVVFATGDRSFIGQIATLAASANSQEPPPLKLEIKRFIIRLTIFAVVLGLLLFGLGFLVGYPALLNFIFMIGVITANVPEGLIVEVVVGLSLTAKKLASRKVLCKNLDAVQTLGATSCICSDKTGTLTMNKMTASSLWYSGKLCKAANRQKNGPTFDYEYDVRDPGFISFQETACVCSIANFDRSLPGEKKERVVNDRTLKPHEVQARLREVELEWEERLKHMFFLDMPTTGDASEAGLIKFFQPLQDINQIRERYPVVSDKKGKECRIPFNSTIKYAFSINEYPRPDSHYCVFIKGAPQNIWKLSTYVDVNGQRVVKTSQWEERFQAANRRFGENGERVLGFAKVHLPASKYPRGCDFNVKDAELVKDQCFVGMLSLTDPPRDAVPNAVLKCRSAGIKVIMVTGDQLVTAAAIAKLCHIITEETVNEIAERKGVSKEEVFHESDAIVVHGDELSHMAAEDEGLPQQEQGKKLENWLSKKQIVFARTTPAQKLIIVKGCQKLGHVVAVTGDGVNDSPAIKKADIGISMGITGTEVAKDAADMILLNDDFSAIVIGVEEGRKIYDNLKKSICYALTSQICQMLPFIGFIIFQFPLPVTTVIVLYISIGTDLIPAIAFAYEPGELDIMTRRPRSKLEHMVTMKLMAQAYGYMGWTEFWGAQFCYYVVANDFGFPPSQLQFIANVGYYNTNPGDVYNPTSPTFGNTMLPTSSASGCPSTVGMVDWIYTANSFSDLRLIMLKCSASGTTLTYSQVVNWGPCNVQQISPFTNLPVCYTTEAMKYAQSAYFYGTVLAQISNAFVCKTRKLSFLTQGLSNVFLLLAITTEIFLIIVAGYFQPFNTAFGTRDNIFLHYGIPVIPFAIFQLMMDQTRKYLIRNLPPDSRGIPHWFSRAALW